jgi:hypothetical protein
MTTGALLADFTGLVHSLGGDFGEIACALDLGGACHPPPLMFDLYGMVVLLHVPVPQLPLARHDANEVREERCA